MNELREAKLSELVNQCRDQTTLYARRENYDARYCFEIWRRAVVDRDEHAWQAAVEQYSVFVRRWLSQRLQNQPALRFEEEVLVNGVFINFFRFVGPDKFASFPNLPSVLQYLKLCCGTLVIDAQRDLQARQSDVSLEKPVSTTGDTVEEGTSLGARLPAEADLEAEVLQRADRAKFWEAVWQKLTDPTDRLLIYLRYVQDMPPREIIQRYPQKFSDITEVYRRNKNILWRLRNSEI